MSTPPLFGVVVPGRPVITEFQVVDDQRCITLIDQPWSITEVTFFLVNNGCIPPGYGAILFYAVPPFTNWVLLGSIDPSKPSGIFRTSWTTNEEIQKCSQVQLGVSLEPLETIRNLEITNSGVEDRFSFAHKIALDLFQYLSSFTSSSSGGNNTMVVPVNIFDRWLERFERRYKMDPNFMMKN